MDGIFSKSIPLKLCSFQRPKERGILGCLKPALGAGQFSQLLDDWLRYHRLMGVDHFMLYDVDGSIEPLLSGGTFSTLLQQGRLTYVPRFSGHMGPRIENLTAELWRRGLGQICVQPRHVNHCLALSRSAGFEWFVYLRGMDKYLHSDVDPSSGMLRRFLNNLAITDAFLPDPIRRHCVGTDPVAMQAARLSASVLPVPVFSQFQRCEPLQLSVDDFMRDESWVPAMRPSVDFAMTNMAVDFNQSTESTTFAVVPVRLLRAQHFVRAFEAGEFGPRSYAPDMKDGLGNRCVTTDQWINGSIMISPKMGIV